MITYRVDFWHTTRKAWYQYHKTDDHSMALNAYDKALAWHYAGIVRLVKVTENILKQSREPNHG